MAMGLGVSATLLVLVSPEHAMLEVYAAAKDIPAGSPLAPDSVVLLQVNAAGLPQRLFTRGDATKLVGLHATHDLASGQLIQGSYVTSVDSIAVRRLVFVPVKDAPPAAAGSKVDLLFVDGTLDHLSVSPFALGVEVRASVAGGFVVAVSSRQAAAFVYAASAMHLAAVVADPGTSNGAEGAVSTVEQAMAVAAQP